MANKTIKSSQSLSHAAGRNVIWSVLDYGVVPLGMLVATPVLIHYLGIEQYGFLLLVTTFIGFSSIFNFGFGDTALKYVAHYNQLNDRSRVIEIIRTIGILGLISGIAVGALFFLSAPFMIITFKLDSIPGALNVLFVTSLIMPLKLMESIYVATLRGSHRYDLAAGVTVFVKVSNILFQVIAAIAGYSLPILLLAVLITSMISNAILFTIIWMKLGNIFPGFSKSAFSEIKQFGMWSWTQGLAGLIYSSTDRLLISAIIGPAGLGIYGVCIQLAQNIHYGLSAAAHSLFPHISMLNSKHINTLPADGKSLRDIYLQVTRLLTITAVLMGSLMAVFSYEILEIWVGQEIATKGHLVLALLSLSFSWFASNSIVTYYTLNGLGRAKLQAGVSVTSAIIMAATSILFIPIYGLMGAAAVRLPDSIFRMGIKIFITRRIIGNISAWVSFDFLRITIVMLVSGYFFRNFLVLISADQNILKDPVNLFLLVVFSIVMYIITNNVEIWVSKSRPFMPSEYIENMGKNNDK